MHTLQGRPRDARTHAAILSATVALVVEAGYGALAIGGVASRAGVGKDAIYRRFSGKPELVYEAVFASVDMAPIPNTNTLIGDVTILVEGLVAEFAAPAAAAALPGLLADFAAQPALRMRIREDFLAAAKARLVEVFDRAAARGELASDVPIDLILDSLAGSVLFHVGLIGGPVTPELAGHLAAMVVTGIQTR
ncbi:TetR/AcrR family transcriptional regulator [Arthrobacter sp. CG_A4]|uniref:TetR/AcrR family transcriptional regulator n=1 Tax=Arthrobacter sp. CG_A4 TaxID=3071706 RepID=UPI002E0346D2|nr:AcrR family transcriptional regulator [Arthrobacter sp. CG_A4]